MRFNLQKLVRTTLLLLFSANLFLPLPLFSIAQAQTTPSINLTVTDITLTDAQGHTHPNNVFAPNEPIYVQIGVRNTGSSSAPSGTVTEIYANQPSAVATNTKDSPEFAILHGSYAAASQVYTYQSWSGGHWESEFVGSTRSFQQAATGTYTARAFVDYADSVAETSETDNQMAVTYQIQNASTPTPTPTATPTNTPTPTQAPTATPTPTAQPNLVAKSLVLTDSRGYTHQDNIFAPNEPIFVRVGVQNTGDAAAPAGVVTEVYANKPSTVLVHTRDNPEFVITHGTFYATTTPFVYESYPGGHWLSSFGSTKSFKQSAVGTYTARIYVDADNMVTESGSDNQLTTTYKISNTWPQPVVNPSAYDAIVNKKYILPSTYAPSDLVQVNFDNNGQPLRRTAASALNNMRADAAAQGVYMRLISGYRSYQTQVDTYNYWVQQDGQAAADQASARPGHSEHQLGLAADLSDEYNTGCDLYACFADTAAGQWLAKYAANYGFILRYPYGKDSITGYEYEPWHFRYVGVTLAKAIKASGLTMEEYFHVPGGGY